MIKLDRPKRPQDFETRPAIASARDAIAAIVQRGEAPASDDFANAWKDFKDVFIAAQHGGKCAYCETRFLGGYPGDVEHVRPKAEVRDVKDPGVRKSAPRRDRTKKMKAPEQGYWWLAYEWKNWLVSCKTCNSSWKGNQFPLVSGTRAMKPGAEKYERPGLLNPMDIDPWNHLDFKADGDVEGLTPKGEATVQVVGLDRWALVDERRRVAERLLDAMVDWGEAVASGNKRFQHYVLRDIAGSIADDAPYAGMCRWLVDESPLLGRLRWTEIRDLAARSAP